MDHLHGVEWVKVSTDQEEQKEQADGLVGRRKGPAKTTKVWLHSIQLRVCVERDSLLQTAVTWERASLSGRGFREPSLRVEGRRDTCCRCRAVEGRVSVEKQKRKKNNSAQTAMPRWHVRGRVFRLCFRVDSPGAVAGLPPLFQCGRNGGVWALRPHAHPEESRHPQSLPTCPAAKLDPVS